MLAVITDGVPDSKSAVRNAIEEARQRMYRPDEIQICFFLIGGDRAGESFIDELANKFPAGRNGGIVDRHSFASVNQVGLPRSLAFAANR